MRKHVWKLHGVDDTWMTPSSSNPRSPHTVKLSSSGRVSCDKDCPGYNAYFICAHTVAVADKAGILTDFIKWHRKEIGGTNLTALANVGIPSSSGKKSTTSSKRKGAANKKPSNAPTVSSRLTCRETSTHPKPSRPVPAFGAFAIASMKFLDSKLSVCYGCGQTLKPEKKIPEEPGDLVIVGITRRKYWKDGVEMTSSQMSNVYYHLNPNCAAKQNTFVIPALIKVPEDLKPFLNSKHIEILRERLNVTVTQE